MRIYIEDNYDAMSVRAAGIIAAEVTVNPACVLGLATGTTPIGIYEQLIRKYEQGELDFSEVTTVNLDEYCGLDGNSPHSYRYFMNHTLFDHINIDKDNTFVPDGMTKDMEETCENYDALIESMGGTDLQLLGLGQNGHIGFNEPGEFIAETHPVELSENTIKANARLFDDISQVPTMAVTMGLKSIMSARTVLLVVNGKQKSMALKKALFGPITPKVPASILQLHPNLIVVADKEALPV